MKKFDQPAHNPINELHRQILIAEFDAARTAYIGLAALLADRGFQFLPEDNWDENIRQPKTQWYCYSIDGRLDDWLFRIYLDRTHNKGLVIRGWLPNKQPVHLMLAGPIVNREAKRSFGVTTFVEECCKVIRIVRAQINRDHHNEVVQEQL